MKMKVRTALSPDLEGIKFTVKYSDDLRDKIKKFSCTGLKTEEYSVVGEKRKRYKIKKVLADNFYFDAVYYMLFDKELIDNGEATFNMSESLPVHDIKKNIANKLKKVVEAIAKAEDLDGKEVTINLNVK